MSSTVVSGLNQPSGLAIDASGNLFIANTGANDVIELAAGSTTPTIAVGTGSAGYSGDNGLASNAQLNLPTGLAVDSQGDLFIAEAGNNVIREVKVPATGPLVSRAI